MSLTDLETLPVSWASATLSEITQVNPKPDRTSIEDNRLVSFIPMAAVDAGSGLMHPEIDRPWEEVKKGFTLFQEGDVLFAKITPCMENGKAAIASGLTNGAGAGSTEFFVLRPHSFIEAKFLLYFVLQENFRREARLQMRGNAGQLRVPKEFFDAISIPIPPLAEQRRIVAEIETQFTRLDAAVAALERARANLKRYRAATLSHAIQGRFTSPVPIGGQALGGRDNEDLPFRLPSDWKWQIAREVCESIECGSTPPSNQMTTSGEIPFIKVYNLTRVGKVDFTTKPTFISREVHEGRLKRSRIRPGDVLMNIVGPPLGKVAIVPHEYPEWNTNQAVVIFRPDSELSADFLCFALLTEPVLDPITRQAKATAGQFNISLTMCRNAMIPVPPLSEQLRIVDFLREQFSIADELESAIDASLKRAQNLRQSVLKQAFAGELVPQCPDDEPLSVLLERIRAERATMTTTEKRIATPKQRAVTDRESQSVLF